MHKNLITIFLGILLVTPVVLAIDSSDDNNEIVVEEIVEEGYQDAYDDSFTIDPSSPPIVSSIGGDYSYDSYLMKRVDLGPCLANLHSKVMAHLVLKDYSGAIKEYLLGEHSLCSSQSWESNRNVFIQLMSR